jgi:hypothetical protein
MNNSSSSRDRCILPPVQLTKLKSVALTSQVNHTTFQSTRQSSYPHLRPLESNRTYSNLCRVQEFQFTPAPEPPSPSPQPRPPSRAARHTPARSRRKTSPSSRGFCRTAPLWEGRWNRAGRGLRKRNARWNRNGENRDISTAQLRWVRQGVWRTGTYRP